MSISLDAFSSSSIVWATNPMAIAFHHHEKSRLYGNATTNWNEMHLHVLHYIERWRGRLSAAIIWCVPCSIYNRSFRELDCNWFWSVTRIFNCWFILFVVFLRFSYGLCGRICTTLLSSSFPHSFFARSSSVLFGSINN